MSGSSHIFQAPKGTRDFYPPDMAVRRYMESVWRETLINHGFEEIEGPTFEHIDLYTVKSGQGIVNELFSFKRAGGEVTYALRPEFTPTLARMVVARGAQLPKPIKWFSTPIHYRAERPQRGRLREFGQWNVDFIGDDSPRADAEVIAVAVAVLKRFGLTPEQVKIKVSHRQVISKILRGLGVRDEDLPQAFELLDRRDKYSESDFALKGDPIGLTPETLERFDEIKLAAVNVRFSSFEPPEIKDAQVDRDDFAQLAELAEHIEPLDIGDWLEVDFSIVRGLAYYTGTVFEIYETTGEERAIAGGGRYDELIELFGGPPTPAVGFAMGDVVIKLVLQDHSLLEPAQEYLPRPDVFVINALDDDDTRLVQLVAGLRGAGLHIRHSYRLTRNVGKLLGEANKCRARFAVILGEELQEGKVILKNLESGEQRELPYTKIVQTIAGAVST